MEFRDYLPKFKKLKVLVIGETMIDRYYYGKQMSQFRVECLLEFFTEEVKDYLGGAGLVANNIASFVDNVDLITLCNKNLSPINKKLHRNVCLLPVIVNNYPIPLKCRYVDKTTGRYYFKSTEMNDRKIDTYIEKKVIERLKLNKYDIIIVIDKGHGMLTDGIIKHLLKFKGYLSVNCQANSENYGYNRVDRYKKVNLVMMNQREIRSLLQNKYDDMYILIKKVSEILQYDRIVVTLGKDGCIISDNKKILTMRDDKNTSVVDPIGAGDAVQVITTLLSATDCPLEMTGKIGNMAGYIVCQTLGTDIGLTKEAMYEACHRY